MYIYSTPDERITISSKLAAGCELSAFKTRFLANSQLSNVPASDGAAAYRLTEDGGCLTAILQKVHCPTCIQ